MVLVRTVNNEHEVGFLKLPLCLYITVLVDMSIQDECSNNSS